MLTPTMIEDRKDHLAHPELIPPSMKGSGIIVTSVHGVDSRDDARVQVADLLAGTGRVVTEQALLRIEHPLPATIRPIITQSIWEDISAQASLSADPRLPDAGKVVDAFS